MRAVPDPRSGRKKKHDHAEILTYMVIGYLVGRCTIRRCLAWCKRHEKWLKKYMKLENGIASCATVSRLLSGVDEELFALTFMEWIGEILSTKGIHIAIDGKALKGATEKVKDFHTPMTLNAIDAATGLVLGQLALQEKENEVSGIHRLLQLLDIRQSTVTIDAIATNTGVMRRIVEQGGHFVLTVKGNNPKTCKEVLDFMDTIRQEYHAVKKDPYHELKFPEAVEAYEEFDSMERNRDRYEYRNYGVCNATDFILRHLQRTEKEWTFVKSIGYVSCSRIPLERDAEGNDITPSPEEFRKNGSRRKPKPMKGDDRAADIQKAGLVSDMTMGAQAMGNIKRAHWSIENRLHHVLDDTFREDRCPAKRSKNNLALIRKFTYNILRMAMNRLIEPETMPEMMDLFADDLCLVQKYVFEGIESFY